VTGAAGRLGRAVTDRLGAEGKSFTGLDATPAAEGAWISGDLRDDAFCRAHLAGADTIIHLASNLDNDAGQQVYDDNAAMNANVFGLAAEFGAKQIIFASSIQVLGWQHSTSEAPWGFEPGYLPFDQNSSVHPANTPYALSKAMGEDLLARYCEATGGSGIALRLPRLMTAGDFVPWSHALAARGLLWVALSYLDAARLVSRCLDLDLPGFHAYLPAGPDAAWGPGRREFLDRYYPTVPCRVPPEEMPGLVDCQSITAETGWVPLSWEEQLEQAP